MTKRHRKSEIDYEKLVERVEAEPAVFTLDQVRQGNRSLDEIQYVRKIAAFLLSRSGRELMDDVAGKRDLAVALAEWSDQVKRFEEKTQATLEMVTAAYTRLIVALACRDDMDQVLNEARGKGATSASDPAFREFLRKAVQTSARTRDPDPGMNSRM